MSSLGELAAVATSCSWTLCGLAFALAGRRIGALALNQIRIVCAVAILLVVHALAHGTPFPLHATPHQLVLLSLSGLAGLALGDLFYFHSISVLGPRLGALLMATAPLFCAVLAWPVLDEALGAPALGGIALTLGGVAVVLADRGGEPTWRAPAASRRLAVVAGLLGALGQGAGLVLAKLGMLDGADVSPLSATVVRMLAGMAGVLLLAGLGGRIGPGFRAARDRRAMAWTLVGVLFGPTLGVWLSLVAVRHTDAGVAAALAALPPVLMIPVARVAYGARPSRVAIAGTVAAVLGAAALFLREPV